MTDRQNVDYERYRCHGYFGEVAAINNTSACNECGAVVYDTAAHDRWHDHMDELWRLQERQDGSFDD
jgi:hypothetical protein